MKLPQASIPAIEGKKARMAFLEEVFIGEKRHIE